MAPARRWIRLDVTWEESAWLDALDGAAAGCWPRLLCLVKRDGVKGRARRPDPAVVARRWRVTRDTVTALEQAAIEDGALSIEDGEWVVTNWAEYQDIDATAAERKRRQRGKSAPDNDLPPGPDESRDVTPVTRDTREVRRDPSRDIDSDIEIQKKRSPTDSQKKRAVALPDGWRPNDKHRSKAREMGVDCDREASRMRDWAAAKGEMAKDWDARFRLWLDRATPNAPGGRKPAQTEDWEYRQPLPHRAAS